MKGVQVSFVLVSQDENYYFRKSDCDYAVVVRNYCNGMIGIYR